MTTEFTKWHNGLRDSRAHVLVRIRMDRLIEGLIGDANPVGEGVHELRIDYGPGYRVYFSRVGLQIVLLLGGGTKKTQHRDIQRALELNRNA
jgi:putative addiction module killer protein